MTRRIGIADRPAQRADYRRSAQNPHLHEKGCYSMTIAMTPPTVIEIPNRPRRETLQAPIKMVQMMSEAERPKVGDDAQMSWTMSICFRVGSPIMFSSEQAR